MARAIHPKHQSALTALAGLAEVSPYALYSPGPVAERFHRSRSKRRLIRAPNRSGKTWAGSHEAWTQAVENPGTTGLVVAADWAGYRDVIARTMWEQAPRHLLYPESAYSPSRGWKNHHIQLTNGSSILFRSARSQTTSLAGIRASWLWADEPPPRELWGEMLSRVATDDGPVWLTFTPIGGELGWLREIVEDPAKGWDEYVIQLTPKDCPHRTQEDIDSQVASYGAWEMAQRARGEWEGVTLDRALEGFSEASVDGAVPTLEWSVGLGLDHGEGAGRENCVLILWNSAKKLLWIIDEYVSTRSTTPEEDAVCLRSMLLRHRLDPVAVDSAVGDTNSAGKGSGGRVNDLIGHALGVRVGSPSKGPGSVEWGTRLLDVALRRGQVRVHPRCGATIAAMKHWTGKEEHKDLIDAVRYVATPILESFFRGPELDRLRLLRA